MSDQQLRHLERKLQAHEIDIEVFDQACRRHGKVGPILANACQLLARIWPNYLHNYEIHYSEQYDVIIQSLQRITWMDDASLLMRITRQKGLYGRMVLEELLENMYEEVAQRHEEADLPSIFGMLPSLLNLYLLNNSFYPTREHQEVAGVVLRRESPEDFLSLVKQAAGAGFGTPNWIQAFEYATNVIENGHVDIWTDNWDKDDYEKAAKFLPPDIYHQLETDWKANIRFFPRIADYLINQYQSFFDNALTSGYEAYVFGELYREYTEAVNNLRWESGAISFADQSTNYPDIQSNFGAIIVWISADDLLSYIKTSLAEGNVSPFEDLLESLDDAYRPQFEEQHYGEDLDAVKDFIADNYDDLELP